MSQNNRNRLPKSLKPISYDLTLEPNLVECTFKGAITATFSVEEENVSTIVLHAADLNIDTAAVVVRHVPTTNGTQEAASKRKSKLSGLLRPGSKKVPQPITTPKVADVQVLGESEKIVVELSADSGALVKNEHYQVDIKFDGILNDKLIGFYRSTYIVRDDTKKPGEEGYEVSRNMATTQFEACDARRAFPCWDEPKLRAIFNICIILPKSDLVLTALSNMPVKNQEQRPDGTSKVTFFPTPPLSSYLVAFVVAELEKVTMLGPRGLPVSVYGTPGQKDKMDFACRVGVGAIEQLEKLFGINYPLPKLDLIAVADFSIGAMENMGLVTFRSSAILVDAMQSSPQTKIFVASIISHELSHLWFGDLVSIEWWSQLWLKEGFATYFGWYVTDALFPEWEVWNIFVSNTTKGALNIDSLASSHPVEVPVATEDQINETFDAISYNKGASILRMLGQFLGAEKLRAGLQLYLNRHKWHAATTDMLWEALEESSGVPVTQVMPCWTRQQGYPVLSVERNGAGFQVSQRHFVHVEDGADSDRVWQVPVFVSSGSLKETAESASEGETFLLVEKSKSVAVAASAEWVSFNTAQCGFYRVQYSPEMRKALGEAIRMQKTSGIPATTRFSVQDDAFALSRFGHVPLSDALDLIQCYVDEKEHSIWQSLLSNSSIVRKILRDQPDQVTDKFNGLMIKILTPLADRLGWFQVPETEDPSQTALRSLVLGHLIGSKHKVAVDKCVGMLDQLDSVHPSLQTLVMKTAVSELGEPVYEKVMQRYTELDLQEAKLRCVAALGGAQEKDLMVRTLQFGLSEKVRSQDVATVFAAVCGSGSTGYKSVWQFLQDNWTEIDSRYGTGGSKLLGKFVTMLGNAMSSKEDAADLTSFFQEHPAPAATQAIAQAVEQINKTASWIERDAAGAIAWVNSL